MMAGETRVLMAAIIIITAVLAGPAAGQKSQAWTWCVNDDNRYSADQQISGCTSVLQSANESKKNTAIALNNRGNAYHAKKNYDRAIEDYDRAIKLDPGYARAFYNRGISYSDKGDQTRAIDDYDQAIRFNPNYTHAYSNRGYAYARTKDYDRSGER